MKGKYVETKFEKLSVIRILYRVDDDDSMRYVMNCGLSCLIIPFGRNLPVPIGHDGHGEYGIIFLKVWLLIRHLAGMESVAPILEDIITWFLPIATKHSFNSIVGKLLFGAAAYYIWIERNNHLFKKSRRSPKEIRDLVVVTLKQVACHLADLGSSSLGLEVNMVL
ncbi:hypothetical protein Tco_0520850 [Tanacetum coccineum]